MTLTREDAICNIKQESVNVAVWFHRIHNDILLQSSSNFAELIMNILCSLKKRFWLWMSGIFCSTFMWSRISFKTGLFCCISRNNFNNGPKQNCSKAQKNKIKSHTYRFFFIELLRLWYVCSEKMTAPNGHGDYNLYLRNFRL